MIRLCNNYVVNADENQWIVGKSYKDKNGNEVIAHPRYYSNLSTALQSVLNANIRQDVSVNDYDLKTAIKRATEIENDFKSLIDNALNGGNTNVQ